MTYEIIQETEVIETEDIDSGLIPRPAPQDVDTGLIPRADEPGSEDTQSLFKLTSAAGLWIQAEIGNGICTGTHWHAPFAELREFGDVPAFEGETLDALQKAGFKTAVDCGLQQYVNENRNY